MGLLVCLYCFYCLEISHSSGLPAYKVIDISELGSFSPFFSVFAVFCGCAASTLHVLSEAAEERVSSASLLGRCVPRSVLQALLCLCKCALGRSTADGLSVTASYRHIIQLFALLK